MTAPEPPAAPTRPRRSRRKPVLIAALVLVVLAGAGVASWLTNSDDSPMAPQTFEVRGTIAVDDALADDGFSADGYRHCTGNRGYDDIRTGAQVTVYDAAGKAVALGELGESRLKDGACQLGFLVREVPAGAGIYEVEVAHRGKLRYEEERLVSGEVSLTLG